MPTVVVGYTSGYSGEYVARTGALMFGLGVLVGYAIGQDDHHYHHYHRPHWYSYGCHARYDYYRGHYVRPVPRHYGPYGGAGRYAAYNPRTGTYSRGAYRYGPRGSAHARQAYNPHTDRYAARAGGSSVYGSWGRTVVADGDDWARAGHKSNWKGTVAGFETSEGAKGVAGKSRVTGDKGFAVKSAEGDVYVGRDGNIYKRDQSGDWNKRSKGSWDSVPRTQTTDRSRVTTRQRPSTGTVRDTSRTRPSTSSVRPSTSGDRTSTSGRTTSTSGRRTSTSGRTTSTRGSSSVVNQLNRESSSRQRGQKRTDSYRSRSSSRSSGRSSSRTSGRSSSGTSGRSSRGRGR